MDPVSAGSVLQMKPPLHAMSKSLCILDEVVWTVLRHIYAGLLTSGEGVPPRLKLSALLIESVNLSAEFLTDALYFFLGPRNS